MQLRPLIEALPGKKSSAYLFERGRFTQHRYADLHADIVRVRDRLAGWGVVAGMRVGIYAPNSYWWLVCPVDCIAMVPVPETVETWKWKYPVVKLTLAEPA